MAKTISIKKEDGKLYIYTPFNRTFVSRIKKTAGGRWNGEAWTVHEDALDTVRKILMDIYGETDIYTPEYVNVRLNFESSEDFERKAFSEFGRDIVIANGRDSGAWMGRDCVLNEGTIGSGGSRQYWETQIAAGTIITVLGVPKPLADNVIRKVESGEYCYDMTCEIISSPKEDLEELKAERERLLNRIKEIDLIIEQNV